MNRILTILGAACTSEKFRVLLFHRTKYFAELYPELMPTTKEEEEFFTALTADRGFPNPLELGIAKVHALLISVRHGECTYPCSYKLEPTAEQMNKIR